VVDNFVRYPGANLPVSHIHPWKSSLFRRPGIKMASSIFWFAVYNTIGRTIKAVQLVLRFGGNRAEMTRYLRSGGGRIHLKTANGAFYARMRSRDVVVKQTELTA
jgi:hypothetical protein